MVKKADEYDKYSDIRQKIYQDNLEKVKHYKKLDDSNINKFIHAIKRNALMIL